MKSLALIAFCALASCATVREHPVVTSLAIAIAAGSIAASQNRDNRTPRATSTIGTPNCSNPAVCQ